MPFGFPFSLCGLIFVDLDSLWARMPGGKQKFRQKASQAMALSWHQLGAGQVGGREGGGGILVKVQQLGRNRSLSYHVISLGVGAPW